MEIVHNKILEKLVISDDTETMNTLKKQSTITQLKSHGNFGCFAFKNQIVTLKNSVYIGFCVPAKL